MRGNSALERGSWMGDWVQLQAYSGEQWMQLHHFLPVHK